MVDLFDASPATGWREHEHGDDRGMPPARSRAPTLRDVARLADIAPITASRILNGNPSGTSIAEETRRRVERIAGELGYKPHASARAMRQQRTRQIGVVVANDPQNPLTNLPAYEYILGLNSGLEPLGLVLSLVRRTEVDNHLADQRAFAEQMFDAFVVVSHLGAADTARLLAGRVPVVWLDANHYGRLGCLRRDEVAAGRAAAGLLVARGRREVIWLYRPKPESEHYSHGQRLEGARAACRAAGVTFTIREMPAEFIADPTFGPQLLAEVGNPQTGLLASDPQITRWVLFQLAQAGVVPGRDVGFVSCDSDHAINAFWPGLSRVAVAREPLGRQAATYVASALTAGTLPASHIITSPVVAGDTA
jgi:LacI family transcriptional regulator